MRSTAICARVWDFDEPRPPRADLYRADRRNGLAHFGIVARLRPGAVGSAALGRIDWIDDYNFESLL